MLEDIPSDISLASLIRMKQYFQKPDSVSIVMESDR